MTEIARLRWLLAEDERLRAAWASDESVYAELTLRREAARALPALLDRLKAAEAVVEAAREADRRRQDHGRDAAAETALHDALRRYDEVRRG